MIGILNKLKIMKNNGGSLYIYTFIIVFVLLILTSIVMEIYRIHSLQSHIEYELQRAVNISVEESIHDTWRIDKENKLDLLKAHEDFYSYLYHDLMINKNFEKINNGEVEYILEIKSLISTYEPPKMLVKGNITCKSKFKFLINDIVIPFEIASKNTRID